MYAMQDYSKQVIRYREGRLREFGTLVLFPKPRAIRSQQGLKFTSDSLGKSQKLQQAMTSLRALLQKYQSNYIDKVSN